jgi:hypothetical protein
MRPNGNWLRLACSAALAAGALGCGGGSDPRATLEEYFEALGNGDGAKACEFFTAELLVAEGLSKEQCARELSWAEDDSDRDEYAHASESIAKVEEDGDRATVMMTEFEFDSFELQRVDGDWKISRMVD